ncbi:MAG: hypothetical protein MUD06_00530 [Rhodospirillales bacterium]|nr:hypothetical protein [Rhodospirillales bacterium]
MSTIEQEQSTFQEPSGPEGAANDVESAARAGVRPTDLPERFWDDDASMVRTDALIAAYLELERQAEGSRRSVPANPEDYVIKVENDLFASDEAVNKELHAAGFDQEQVQLVYDLAAQRLLPVAAELASRVEAQSQAERLKQDFGGEEPWREVARQIRLWGENNLAPETFSILASSREGVLAMHKMMSGHEPELLRSGGRGAALPTEGELKQMMRDPRYWRDRDPGFVERVREGFRQLYDQ